MRKRKFRTFLTVRKIIENYTTCTVWTILLFFAAKRPVRKTKENTGKQKKTCFFCFCFVYFPLVSERVLDCFSNMHLSAKLQPYWSKLFTSSLSIYPLHIKKHSIFIFFVLMLCYCISHLPIERGSYTKNIVTPMTLMIAPMISFSVIFWWKRKYAGARMSIGDIAIIVCAIPGFV